MIKSYKACSHVLNNQQDFKGISEEAVNLLDIWQDGSVLTGDGSTSTPNREQIHKCLYPRNWDIDVRDFFAGTTDRLLYQYSESVTSQTGLHDPSNPQHNRTREVDIVRDVIALSTTHFTAALWSLPIKSHGSPQGVYSHQQLYQILMTCYAAIFSKADIGHSFELVSQA